MRATEIRGEVISTFINDTDILLPRFQRKQTWSNQKNFNFVISVFRKYPLGAVVFRNEYESLGTAKWLIDGRQRRNVLVNLRRPEKLYMWAKNVLKLKNSMDENKVVEAFIKYIRNYLEYPELEDEEEIKGEEFENIEIENQMENDKNIVQELKLRRPQLPQEEVFSGLEDLISLILLVHPKTGFSSGFTKPFDFRKELESLPYTFISDKDSKKYIDADKLTDWIGSKMAILRGSRPGDRSLPSKEEFLSWLIEGRRIDNRKESTLRKRIDKEWQDIELVLTLIDSLERRFRNQRIGYIELFDCGGDDAKKIFTIINDGGTTLKAVEILSARRVWNIKVEEPSKNLMKSKEELYESIGVKIPEDVVRWDVAATLINRLRIPMILGDL